ncbi:MAG: hypothetical protein HN726_02960 [Candidatus Magasanikbacteria bacterium]|nr:hypothetical protein [Candidatus Magasanikbacteria bacterium]
MLFISMVGVGIMLIPGYVSKLLGLFLLYLGLILDGVDGEIARHKKLFSIKGLYIDSVYHLLIPGAMLITLATSIATETQTNMWYLCLCALAAIGWIIIKTGGQLPFHLYAKHFLGKPGVFPLPAVKVKKESTETTVVSKPHLIRRILGIRFQVRQFFIAMVLLAISLVVDVLFLMPQSYELTWWVLGIYSCFLILHTLEEVFKMTMNIEGIIANIHRSTTERWPKVQASQEAVKPSEDHTSVS